MEGKQCPKCGSTERTNENRCRPCRQAQQQARYLANRDDAILQMRAWYAEKGEHHRTRRAAFYKSNQPTIRRARLLKKHGITETELRILEDAAQGRCEICGQRPGENETLCIDHDHRTNQIRGMLCSTCNLAIGQFEDNPFLLRRAAEYLEEAAAPRLAVAS